MSKEGDGSLSPYRTAGIFSVFTRLQDSLALVTSVDLECFLNALPGLVQLACLQGCLHSRSDSAGAASEFLMSIPSKRC